MQPTVRPIPAWIRLVALLLLAGLLAGGLAWAVVESGLIPAFQAVWRQLGSVEGIRAWVARFGAAAPLAMLAILVAQAVLLPIPAMAPAAASGFLFGPWVGTLLAVAGVTAGSVLAFLLARALGRPWVVRLLSPELLARLDKLVHRRGAAALFLIFLIPFLPDDAACLVAGLSPIPFRLFLVLLVLGRSPAVVVASLTGAGLAASPLVWVGLGVAALLPTLLLIRHRDRLWRWLERQGLR